MAKQKVDGLSLGVAAAGSLFVYAGIKGYSIPHAIQSLIQGQKPTVTANPVSTPAGITVQTATGPGVANPHAGTWTHDGLMNLWRMAGGSQGSANNAACHAIQESSGNASVTSPNPDGGINVGLWQLDTKGVGAGYNVSQLQDPLTNARITVRATNDGQDWAEWATPGC